MKALLFPGQGAQFSGMGKERYDSSSESREIFEQADELMGLSLSQIMFEGSEEDLRKTNITQPALFVHSLAVLANEKKDLSFDAVAGHSLGEFSAITAAGCLSFEDAFALVRCRAEAMEVACQQSEGTMAAIVGLDDALVEEVCQSIDDIVVTANYNCPGQLVISGSVDGIQKAAKTLSEKGAKRAIVLEVGGAFHSPLMEPARKDLESKITALSFAKPSVPVYQNVTGKGETDPEIIQRNLIQQLTSPVLWTKTMEQMLEDGYSEFFELGGNGKVLRGLMRRTNRAIPVEGLI